MKVESHGTGLANIHNELTSFANERSRVCFSGSIVLKVGHIWIQENRGKDDVCKTRPHELPPSLALILTGFRQDAIWWIRTRVFDPISSIQDGGRVP